MQAGEVREKVLRDHDALRQRMEEVERLAEEVVCDDRMHDGKLRLTATELLRALRTHMAWEDRFLAPALLEADAWGPERAARLETDHVQQRDDVERILAGLGDPSQPAAFLASRLLEWLNELHADMLDEESAFLDASVLRDDVVGIDVEAG